LEVAEKVYFDNDYFTDLSFLTTFVFVVIPCLRAIAKGFGRRRPQAGLWAL
jgi:hypothetical protein